MASDPLTPLAFSIFENPGVYALLLGSGVSRAADIPTGWEVTLDLVRRAALVEGVAEQADWAAWHREVRGEDPDYSALLAELAPSPGDRRAMLHGFIEPSADDLEAGRRVPTEAHRAIARLVADGFIRVIVTTNFDRLLEAALHDVGVTPTVIGSVDALKGAEPLIHARCTILKVHGDYLDARILNTNDELLTYPPEIEGLLDRILDDHGLIVAGWSGEWDHALRAALLRTPNRRYSLYWANRGAPASAAQALIDHRGGRVLTVQSADAFFSGLAERVETLRQIRRVDPLSLDLLVASTKRHLPRPEERIQLEALFAEEVQRLSERLAGAELDVNRTWSDTEFRRQVTVYEASVETLASMMGVLGRWGDGSETSLAFDVVKLLAGRAHRERSGVEAYIGLQAYPAVLAYTAYGLGAARAGRWGVVHDLFNLRLPRPYESDERLVETLFLWSWSHLPSDTWKSLEGLQDRKTPLSDHLLAVFQVWAPRFLGLTASFELEYERFELMGSLAHLERYSLDSVKTSLADGKDWHWLPVGRTGWNSTDRSRLFEELGGPLRPLLLAAGFAHGSAEFLEAFKTTYGRASRRMSF